MEFSIAHFSNQKKITTVTFPPGHTKMIAFLIALKGSQKGQSLKEKRVSKLNSVLC